MDESLKFIKSLPWEHIAIAVVCFALVFWLAKKLFGWLFARNRTYHHNSMSSLNESPKKSKSINVRTFTQKTRFRGFPTRLPIGKRGSSSMLIEETKTMERARRLAEQQGHRVLARVNAREHGNEDEKISSPEGELQNNILQHPALDSQRFDGIDPNLNPEPPLNTAARREYDNEKRDQEQEKQLRLGNMPKFSTAPTPRGP